jgi:hypothetical protein
LRIRILIVLLPDRHLAVQGPHARQLVESDSPQLVVSRTTTALHHFPPTRPPNVPSVSGHGVCSFPASHFHMHGRPALTDGGYPVGHL